MDHVILIQGATPPVFEALEYDFKSMILTCPKCQSQYNLDPAMLGVSGRDVRCVACSHMWFQIPDTAMQDVPRPAVADVEAPARTIAEELTTILEQDDAAFDAVLSSVAKGTAAAAIEVTPPPARTEKKMNVPQENALAIVTHDPLGMGANLFGAMVFLLCTFLTLAVVFSFKGPLVHRYPQMSLLYRSLGMSVMAPGEGLRISEVTAEKRIDSKSRTLVVQGKMTNMTESNIAYPALHVTLRDGHSLVAKELDLKPGMSEIASGDIVPLMLQLEDVPDQATSVELRVKSK